MNIIPARPAGVYLRGRLSSNVRPRKPALVNSTAFNALRNLPMEDLFENPEDSIDVEPADLGPEFVATLTSSLAKALASQHERPWTNEQESEMQENVSALVAAASRLGLKTIRLIVTRPTGEKVTRDLDVERIGKTRSLQ